MPPAVIAAAIPAVIGGGSALLQHKAANDASKRAFDAEQEKARQAYDARTRRFGSALKKYDMKRGLIKDFISQHGLTPGKTVTDFLDAPDPTAPDFAHAAGSTYQGGPPTNFAGLGGSAAAAAAKLLAPKGTASAAAHDTGDFSGPASGGVGPVPGQPAAPEAPSSAFSMTDIMKGAGLYDENGDPK